MKFHCKRQIQLILLLTLAIEVVPHYLQLRPKGTSWSNNDQVPGEHNFVEVSLVQPKFKSKKLVGLELPPVSRLESSSGKSRHFDWFLSSEDDSESAPATEKGFISEFFEEDEEAEEEKKPNNQELRDDLLRQNQRKKYVKVNKMIFPLLLAYKLKFFTMVPLLIGALILLVGTTGLAGFFFALFAAAAGLQHKSPHG